MIEQIFTQEFAVFFIVIIPGKLNISSSIVGITSVRLKTAIKTSKSYNSTPPGVDRVSPT
jgi:hypothetical protein